MRGELSERSLEDLRRTCTDAVGMLSARGFEARVGKSGKMTYPAVKKGVWTAALLLDNGVGWACPLYEAINAPHWDWFLTTNMDMVNVAVACGLAYGLMAEGKSSDMVARTLEYILMDPCRIPNAGCSKNFECPECDLNWNSKIVDEGVIGRSFNMEWFLSPNDEIEPPSGWDPAEATILFGQNNYGKEINE